MKASCTLITATKPSTVTKEFSLNADKSLDKKTTAHVSAGRMEVVEFYDLKGFSEVLVNLKTNQCLTYGIPPHSPVQLVTENAWIQAGRPKDKLPRTIDAMNWPSGRGILMLDYDAPKNGDTPFTREEIFNVLNNSTASISDIDILWWPSTSSCIWSGNEELSGVKGQRLYIMVDDAQDIPRMGRALNTKLWAQGYGHIEISKSGTLLVRDMFDSAVWQTNRIDFAAGAKCHEGLEQKRGEPLLIEGMFDKYARKADVPDPTKEEVAKAEILISASKAALAVEAANVRSLWIQERIDGIVERNPTLSVDKAGVIARRAVERHELMGDWIVTICDGDKTQEVSVLHLLDHPDKYHGMLTLDPIEPEYDGGRPVGKLFLIGARPRIHSFAHGGASFKLSRQPARIEVLKGNERETTDALLVVLRRAPDVFDFGAELVIIGDDGVLFPQNEHGLRYQAGGMTQFWHFQTSRTGEVSEVLDNPPAGVCKSVLALQGNRRLKKLNAVITAPTLRPNGTVLSMPGFDEATGLLFDADQPPQMVPDNPSKEQAAEALDQVWSVFEEFPFVTAVDRAVHLCAILTAAVRSALPTAPAFAYDAPVQASGKTLLGKCVGAIATGGVPDIWPHTSGRDDEEVRKRLFTALRTGAKAVLWDNVVGTFDSAAMASFLTSAQFRDRVLGKSESSSVPNKALLLMTGNNLTLAGDMARRVLVSRIDPETDRPFARSFKVDPLAVCIAERQKMIAAALTLIRFYLSSGVERPGAGRMASFEEWDDWVRQTVIYVDQVLAPGKFGDVMDQIEQNQASDPEQESLGALLTAWHGHFKNRWVKSKEVSDVCKKHSRYSDFSCEENDPVVANEKALADALDDYRVGTKELNPKSIGKILKFRKDRIVSRLKLEYSQAMEAWRVQSQG